MQPSDGRAALRLFFGFGFRDGSAENDHKHRLLCQAPCFDPPKPWIHLFIGQEALNQRLSFQDLATGHFPLFSRLRDSGCVHRPGRLKQR